MLPASHLSPVSDLTAAVVGGNSSRIRRLTRDIVARLDLRLSGLRVLTEAGSGIYAVTPAIAVAAGADEVIAVSRDSSYGPGIENLAAARAMAESFGQADRLTCVDGRPTADQVVRADIITNLGFVRPIDLGLLSNANSHVVVSLMCEAWEWRPGDVDLAACRRLGVPVLASNESNSIVDVFSFCGPLAGRLLFEAGFEICENKIVVLSSDRFGPVIGGWLQRAGASVYLTGELDSAEARKRLSDADVLLLAEYAREAPVIGAAGLLECARLAELAPDITVVQFAGSVAAELWPRFGIRVFPDPPLGAMRMARTLAALGPRPVIELHAIGLKVGELASRARRSGLTATDVEARLPAESDLCQAIPRRGAYV